MCGIFAYFSKTKISEALRAILYNLAMRSKIRGPDNTVDKMVDENTYLVFHRLCIMDLSSKGDQPLVHPQDKNLTLVCNGEIYNYE